ncbi:hypothetical protein GS445_27505 [Rhodococcus hoagii]|nr:hypothetical protein pRERM680 [Prescottella equi]MBM4549402.1 hypothetical protein [Prescottella equi]MBM4553340.1 hypothetical protein [Prescottella equi]MBM4553351.1 hypothetical protein [Prescottella equi]MBM4575065.1 hypothetical protein [Prescottella equi]
MASARIRKLTRWIRNLAPSRQAHGTPHPRTNTPPTKKLSHDEQLELLDAYRELHDAEKRAGATLGCARGADMSDAATVRALAKVLDYLPHTAHDQERPDTAR